MQGGPVGCREGPWGAVVQRVEPGRPSRSEQTLKEWSGPDSGGCGQRGALTEVAQAVLTGIHAHLQCAHQPQVLHLGQGLLQSQGALSPGDWTAVTPSRHPSLVALGPVPDSPGIRGSWCVVLGRCKARCTSRPSQGAVGVTACQTLLLALSGHSQARPSPTLSCCLGWGVAKDRSWWVDPFQCDSCLGHREGAGQREAWGQAW